MSNNIDDPKFKDFAKNISGVSLGISMVVAVGLGILLGIGLKNLFKIHWLFWIGLFFGLSAAILNVYKAYKIEQRSLKELEKDIKYSHKK